MLSLQTIRSRSDEVRQACLARGSNAPLDRILALDSERRPLLGDVEQMRADRNQAGRRIGKAQDPEERQRLIAEQRGAAGQLDELEARLVELEGELSELLLEVPNLYHPSVPTGGEEAAVVVLAGDASGSEDHFDSPLPLDGWPLPPGDPALRPHWEIGESLGVIDFERGVKLSGANFYLLRGDGARLQRALISWMLDRHRERGYSEVYPPALVNEEMLVGTGSLPKFAETLFHTTDGRWLIPTAEVPVTNMYRDEILDDAALPIAHAAYSPCFRNEQFSAGRDVRGIKRGYQFDKVEMVRFERPEASWDALRALLEDALALVRALGLRYRVLRLASGDLTFSSAMTYDIEIWAPGAGEWLEVSSVSNFTDFQARRANLRFRNSEGSVEHLHTLNGSGLALPRLVATILEQYQLPDGRVEIPPVLQPYLLGQEALDPIGR